VKGRLLLLLALVALGFLVFKLTGDDPGLAGDTTRTAQQTGYYLRDATVTEYGMDGKVRLEVAIRSATEDPARKVGRAKFPARLGGGAHGATHARHLGPAGMDG
jgi:hypothetical protein